MTARTPTSRFVTGQPGWRAEIDLSPIGHLLSSYREVDENSEDWTTDAEWVVKIATGVAAFLAGHNLTLRDDELDEIIQDMRHADRPYELEDTLGRFFDWADGNRIWLNQF